MNKTQMLSETENLLYFKGKNTILNWTKKVTWYSTNPITSKWSRSSEQFPSYTKQENPACFIFVDSFTTNTLQLHKYIKDS
jgi:hypothetical protein